MKATIIALAAFLALATPSLAQRPGGQGGPGGPGGPGGGRQGGGMRMLDQLGLTEAQKTKLKALTEKQREESTALRKKHMEQISELLTPEQKKKLEEARKKAMGTSRGGPGGPNGAIGGGGKPGGGKG
jgi:Spy/CpxP family protein refolding chaperone